MITRDYYQTVKVPVRVDALMVLLPLHKRTQRGNTFSCTPEVAAQSCYLCEVTLYVGRNDTRRQGLASRRDRCGARFREADGAKQPFVPTPAGGGCG